MKRDCNETAKQIKEACGLKHLPALFTNIEYAAQRVRHSIKPTRIILGEVGVYLVVCPADAVRLVRAGFEYAN